MTIQMDARDHWAQQVEALDAQIEAARGAIATATQEAASAVLEGTEPADAARALAQARDRLDVLHAARGEAERHRGLAQHAAAMRDRGRALDRARLAARKRIDVAEMIDSYLTALDPLIRDWVAASEAFAKALTEAGQRAPSHENLCGAYRVRAAAWAGAASLLDAVEAPRVSHTHKQPLRDLSAAQAAPILAKGNDE